jgi:cell division protein FtsW (lipid II flippase)
LKLKFIDTRMFKYIDWMLFANILALVLISFVAIASAVSDPIPAGSTFSEIITKIDMSNVGQQIIWFGIGIVAMFIVLLPDYHAQSTAQEAGSNLGLRAFSPAN